MREAIVICRLSSREGLSRYQRVADALPQRGVHIAEAHMVRTRKDLQKRVRQAVKSGAELLVVIGGDGTQSAAVAELAYSRTILGVVPSGTGNSYALSLGIPSGVDAAIETIAGGRVACVDIGVVNKMYFANFATIGLLADAADRTPRPLKWIAGPVAYGVSTLAALFWQKPFTMQVKWKRNDLRIGTYQAIVASGRYYGHQPLTPSAGITSGKLAFFAASGRSPRDVLATNAALLRGDQTSMEHAHYFAARKITITTKPKQQLNVDGHGIGKTPAKFSVAPKALRVLVPETFTEAD